MCTKMRPVELEKQFKAETGCLDFVVMVRGAQDTRQIPRVKFRGKAEVATRLGKASYTCRDVSGSDHHSSEVFIWDCNSSQMVKNSPNPTFVTSILAMKEIQKGGHLPRT